MDVTFTINGRELTVPKGTTVYNAAKQNGIDIPIFCYQDRMPPFGACRVCLVEVEKMGKLQTSCTLEATEGMVVKTQSEIAVNGREDILEFLLINHPLDCPICDKGGECPLQEHAFNHGPGKSRFFEEKRHFTKPYPLGPVLMLDRERCIVCARCTRFGDEIAGDHALEFIERGFKTEVGTPDGGTPDSKFIGNTISICPVGALTSQVYRFRARPWDNDSVASTCTLCPVGCSMHLDSRDGEIMRTRSRENKDVNDIWMCDKGWFGYEFSSSPDRLKTPLIRKGGFLVSTTWEEAIALIVDKLQKSKTIAGLGGNTLTVEENNLFKNLFKLVDNRVGMAQFADEGLSAGMKISIGECENLDYAILLGFDITEEFPVVWLRLKQAINKGADVRFFGHFAPEVAHHLSQTTLHPLGQELEIIKQLSLDPSKKGAIFVGRQYLSNPNRLAILSELQKKNVPLNIMEGSGGSIGAHHTMSSDDLIGTTTGWDYLHVAGANPALHYSSRQWKEFRAKLGFLVVQDIFLNETGQDADVVLPTLSYVEKGGSFLNIEHRTQYLQPGKEIPTGLFSDAEIFSKISELWTANSVWAPPSRSGKTINTKGDLLGTYSSSLFDHGTRMLHNTKLVQLAKEPACRLHPNEGIKRSLKDGDNVRIKVNGHEITSKIRFDKGVAEKTFVLPLGFPEVPIQELETGYINGFNVEISAI